MSASVSILWRRLAVIGIAALGAFYLLGATALWGYYRFQRQVPGVHWIDIAFFPRFSRVQQAVGAHHLARAKKEWAAGNFAEGVYLARAALSKQPTDPDTRLFLASCWQSAGRLGYATQLLEEGLAFDPPSRPMSRLLAETYLRNGQYRELLALLRVRLPQLQLAPPQSDVAFYRLAEIRGTLELDGADAAAALAVRWPDLQQTPTAAPLLARIDFFRTGPDSAIARLHHAIEASPNLPELHDALIEIALRADRLEESRAAAARFADAFPNLPDAQLRLLEVHATRDETDRQPWLLACMRYLARFRQDPVALEQLANLAARHGWDDLALLLYENSVVTAGRERSFALCYVGSLVARRDFARAEEAWNDLIAQKSGTAESAPVLAAMIAAGAGRAGEAREQVERLRLATKDDPGRRQRMTVLLRDFGFATLASTLAARDT